MRTEKEMMALILNVARQDSRIRAVYTNGSRTNPRAPTDIFQDYDIGYLVNETTSFINDQDWIKVFGDILIMQLPDEIDRNAGHETHFEYCYGYLMQFSDGNRIDLHIETLDYVLKIYRTDKLLITLLDKDNVLPKIPPATDEDYWVKRPTQALLYGCSNEFWWLSLYAAKGLWRSEIPYAMEFLNSLMRPQLIEMLAWYVGIQTDFSASIGKCAKYLDKYLQGETWNKYLKTYPEATPESIWNSLLIMCELFQETTGIVCARFGYDLNLTEAQHCLAYMKHIRQLPKDATEIY
jgi:aminoglycoside 6-adenylyltransferase